MVLERIGVDSPGVKLAHPPLHVGRQPNSGFRLDRIIPPPLSSLFHPSLFSRPPLLPPTPSLAIPITITTNVQLFLPAAPRYDGASKLFHELANPPSYLFPSPLCGQKRKVEKTLSRDVPSGAFADPLSHPPLLAPVHRSISLPFPP
ncbi:hypothetical protein AVEN_80078-1 [Araneus ventricosus]|uniref:Uncharacterized protein n=1 Tax=Araneus ventricosus TaxID=182803 RepID=A0A4Y2B831_ARAVE|nr:hypothetical protein AVEN_80078-1 [Araneus ventricosus]